MPCVLWGWWLYTPALEASWFPGAVTLMPPWLPYQDFYTAMFQYQSGRFPQERSFPMLSPHCLTSWQVCHVGLELIMMDFTSWAGQVPQEKGLEKKTRRYFILWTRTNTYLHSACRTLVHLFFFFFKFPKEEKQRQHTKKNCCCCYYNRKIKRTIHSDLIAQGYCKNCWSRANFSQVI